MASLTKDQATFASTVAHDTGLDPTVVAAWVLSENGGSSANGKHNYLGLGITGSKSYGNTSSFWNDPVAAGHATAEWLKGSSTVIPGYTASQQIQQIAQTAGKPVSDQIAAIQYHGQGGWSTAGEPALKDAYATLKLNLPGDWSSGGGGVLGTGVSNPVSSVTDAVSGIWGTLSNPSLWVRVAEIVGGGILIILGLMQLSGASSPASIVKAAT